MSEPQGSALLETQSLSSGYGEVEIVHDVSLRAGARELVTIIGPNGAGKSTLIKAIFGLLTPMAGRIFLDGKDVTGVGGPQMVGRGAAFVPQTDNVFPSLSIRENLEMGGYRWGGDIAERVDAVLSQFPMLAERPRERASRLSGGQRQTLAIARALMLDPTLLFLDEPTASLSPIARREIFDRVRAIVDGGTAVVMVEQNAKEALAVSERGVVMVAGRVVLEQPGADMLANDEVGRLFLGQSDAPGVDAGPAADEV